MNEIEQLIYDFLTKNTLMTLLDNEEARGYTKERAKDLAEIMVARFNVAPCEHIMDVDVDMVGGTYSAICAKCGHRPQPIKRF